MIARPLRQTGRLGPVSAIISVVVVALGIGGCGGGGKSTTTHSTTTATTAPPVTTTRPAVAPPKFVSETAVVVGAKAWSHTVSVRPGDKIAFRTVTPGTATTPPTTVRLSISPGPASKLTVTVRARGHRSRVVLTSASGKPVTLVAIHYSCKFPPAPTFCPADHVVKAASGYHVQFTTTHPKPIIVSATVGPVNTPFGTAVAPTGSVVPPYLVTNTVRIVPTAKARTATTPAPPTSTVAATAGQSVMIRTKLMGLKGATQTVKITIDQGPGKSLSITSSVPGGQPGHATVTSAKGSPIELVLLRYACFLPPLPTFCPLTRIQAASHRYTITVPASPATAPIDISATVAAG